MDLRHTTVRKNGKTHSYWRLVRSVRRGRRVVQETVAQLGELDGQGRARAGALALQITGREEQYELFEAPPGLRSEPVAVRLDQIRLERARRFGDVWLGWRLWRALALDRFCDDRLVEGRERAPWPAIAAILVIARLCEPASELHIAEDWYRRTALDDLLGVPAARVNDDRLYRALDRLLPHKQALETHLKERLGALFDLDWRTYIQLSEAEAAFRIHKSELSIRPIWHQREDRVLAHILVCFLAYVLWKTLEQWQSRAGLGNSPRTLLQELAAITSTDVILPTAAPPGRELRLRCVVRPDRAQAVLLERLGLRLPEKLRMPRPARTM